MKISCWALYGSSVVFVLILAVCMSTPSLGTMWQVKKKAAKFSGFFSVVTSYFLRRTATKPAKAEPNNHAAAGTGTALVALVTVTLS